MDVRSSPASTRGRVALGAGGFWLAALALTGSAVGCAGATTAATSTPAVLASPAAPDGALALAADAIACTLVELEVSSSRCAAIASVAGGREADLRAVEHGVAERLLEALSRRARVERIPASDRAALGRWLDVGLAAARELVAVRAASRASALAHAREDLARSSDLDALEHAASVDVSGVRARAHFDALRRLADEGGEGAREARVLALVLAASRLDLLRAASSVVREAAIESAVDLAIDVAGASTSGALAGDSTRDPAWSSAGQGDAAERAARPARSPAEPTLETARGRLAARASELCPTVNAPLRALCVRAARDGARSVTEVRAPVARAGE
jgi:hypothetical protein